MGVAKIKRPAYLKSRNVFGNIKTLHQFNEVGLSPASGPAHSPTVLGPGRERGGRGREGGLRLTRRGNRRGPYPGRPRGGKIRDDAVIPAILKRGDGDRVTSRGPSSSSSSSPSHIPTRRGHPVWYRRKWRGNLRRKTRNWPSLWRRRRRLIFWRKIDRIHASSLPWEYLLFKFLP